MFFFGGGDKEQIWGCNCTRLPRGYVPATNSLTLIFCHNSIVIQYSDFTCDSAVKRSNYVVFTDLVVYSVSAFYVGFYVAEFHTKQSFVKRSLFTISAETI